MKRFIGASLVLVVLAAGAMAWYVNRLVNVSGTSFTHHQKELKLADDVPIDALIERLFSDSIIASELDFRRLAQAKKFSTARKGRYLITKSTSYNVLINRLRSGDQDAVRVTFNSTRTPEELAARVSQQMMVDSAELAQVLRNKEVAQHYGFTSADFKSMFIPNTYEFWWTTDANAFLERMATEYKRFWNDDRLAKAAQLKLSSAEVTTLASIVHAETAKRDEAPMVAGLYLNRLRIGMPLQADPTLIYAHNDFTIRRVLDYHKEIDSPYNTYRYKGLPPGPINFPDITYIDAVLNSTKHDYLYMCAKADFSGYHHFSKTLNQHLVYAREYQRAIRGR